MDVSRVGTQSEFAMLIGVSDAAVSMYVSRGVLAEGKTLGEWLQAYCSHLRGIAAGRGGDDGLELTTERAALARAQRQGIEMKNAERRRELAPTRMLEQILSGAATRIARILDTIPGEIKRRVPAATADDIGAVQTIVAKARNVASSIDRKDLFSGITLASADSPELDALDDAA